MLSSERVAVLGATGQLGSDIRRAAEARGVPLTALGHEEVEITNRASLTRRFTEIRPTVVINCAAFHQVDKCEDDPALAFQVNALGALHAARAAAEAGARTVYVSTDYVFPGDKPSSQAWSESDCPRPINTYGVSKLAGEHATVGVSDANLVVRVASLFGVAGARGKGGNFIETILTKAKQGGPLKVVNDQWMTPTYAEDAAGAILDLIAMDARGVVHVTNTGACTWHAFATAAVQLAGLAVPVQPVPASTYPSKARRPANSALSGARLDALLSALRPWPDALKAYLEAKGHIQS
jgi:dTDP-4-dehydrorhamnose reductase